MLWYCAFPYGAHVSDVIEYTLVVFYYHLYRQTTLSDRNALRPIHT
jgi:hypothetical protein